MLKNRNGSFKNLIKMKELKQSYQTEVINKIEDREAEIYSIVDNPRQNNIDISVKHINSGKSLPLFQSIIEKMAIKSNTF